MAVPDLRQSAVEGKRGLAVGLDEAAPRVSLGDIVAERVRTAILNEDLKPGQHLREEEVSELLKVSRGPVRDAFIQLEREGLVRLTRHRGANVVSLSAVDLGEVYSLRSALEELAVRLAIRRHDDRDLEALKQSLADLRSGLKRDLSEQEAAWLDIEFHDAMVQAAHHERLWASWGTIRMQVYWFLRQRNIGRPDWRTVTVKRHQSILQLVRAGREDAAVAEVRTHIRVAYTNIIEQRKVPSDRTDAQLSEMTASFLLA